MFHTHAPGPGLIHYNAGFHFYIGSNSFVFIYNFGQSLHLFVKVFKNENKSIVFQARLPGSSGLIKHGHYHYFWV